MNEGLPNIIEEGPEHIPTQEEVREIFDQLIGEKEYKEVRKLEDEKGLYLWDIVISGEDGSAEYSYMRKGQHPEGKAKINAVHVAFYDKEGMPESGRSVARYIDGEWELKI